MVCHCDCCLGSDAVVCPLCRYIVHLIAKVALVSVTWLCTQRSTIDSNQSFSKDKNTENERILWYFTFFLRMCVLWTLWYAAAFGQVAYVI